MIKKVGEFLFEDLNKMKMEEHPFALSLINSIIKSSLKSSKLIQIGRNPRFFNPELRKDAPGVQIWPGFFTSSWIF